MQNSRIDDPIAQILERTVAQVNQLNDPWYYEFLLSIDRKQEFLTKKLFIVPKLKKYRQQQIGRYGLYNWIFRLWGLDKPLQPEYVISKAIFLFSASVLISILVSFLSVILSLIVLVIGYLIASRCLSMPYNILQTIRSMDLLHYPQTASVFAARDVKELLEILQDVEVIGHEVQSMLAHYLNTPNPSISTLEGEIGDYLNKHPLTSMTLIKDVLDVFRTPNLDIRKQQKLNIMRQFPLELSEYFKRVTNDYKQIQSTSLMFSEMVVFSMFMILAIFGLIETPFSLVLPAVVIAVSDVFVHQLLMRSISIRLFYNFRLAEAEKVLRKKYIKHSILIGVIISVAFGLMIEDPKVGILCIIMGVPFVSYMMTSLLAVVVIEQEAPPLPLHKMIREYISMISCIRLNVGEVSMRSAVDIGLREFYTGPLQEVIRPIITDYHFNKDIHDILKRIHEEAFNRSSILRPYIFFIESIIETSPVKGKKTETNPVELFDIIYEISTQILRPLALSFESIVIIGTSRAKFTGVINGITAGIFIILGKIFQNVLIKGLGNMGSFIGTDNAGNMSNWMMDFMVGMIGTLNGTDLIAAGLISLAGTYLGVYPFQEKRTGAYIISVVSAIFSSYAGFLAMNKLIEMMTHLF
ncbi:hypothetical protein Metho_2512 (plasmid) [Methanomethylovorans hollandica DSM 15978]|uniref:Uncharacterized protein n=1 Tax=Methanomethylovorans hollandica (strain DSM 15978 / NBRC 107637 / DMS1) TaxID=867904 RepID=L0KYW0_METHD|nr:hypothetical protein [Methanomethylovorans hollandica]AGB50652.1 hypothetical protein Metho_2512 [Methanomethylovorans hollandica DSM 15978]